MSASTARHEIRALLRAHLAAASAYRHLTRYCVVCHRLLRLAMEPGGDGAAASSATGPPAPPAGPSTASGAAPEARRRPDGGADSPGGAESEARTPGPKRTGRPVKRTAEEWTGAERPSPT
ncbi:DUF6274 family protein [Streptomyces californicus]|uniref:DUF6274 family protein n=1 Tax=Streptomyces californicus TaxID=67351 RepID=UPI0036C87C54